MKMLHNVDLYTFLSSYWQKKPLLIRNALAPDLFTLTPEELAGLACEEGIESRLITGTQQRGFQLQHGPFDEATFTSLPTKAWTVLVQAVDHVDPEVAALLDYFRFIPNWRIDDIMISYAAPEGSAGPHYDNYDVFLIQGRGTRQWQIGAMLDERTPLAAHSELRLLEQFEAVEQWELEPGDILYLPPRVAHWGISTSDNCMTYSVGFRSPSIAELLSECCDQAIAQLSDEQRYEDPGLALQENPGEISSTAFDSIQRQLLAQLSNRDQLERWIGCYVTQPKYSLEDEHSLEPLFSLSEQLADELCDADRVIRDPATRFAFSQHDQQLKLFVDGRCYELAPSHRPFVELVCANAVLDTSQLAAYLSDNHIAALMLELFNGGSLYFEDELLD